jgi:hypothetical protein
MTGYNEFAKDAVQFFKSAIEKSYPNLKSIEPGTKRIENEPLKFLELGK